MKLLKRLVREDEGAALVEYGLLLAGIAVLAMVAVFALGPIISKLFSDIGTKIGG